MGLAAASRVALVILTSLMLSFVLGPFVWQLVTAVTPTPQLVTLPPLPCCPGRRPGSTWPPQRWG